MPRVFKLTQKSVEVLSCPPGRKDALVFDGELRGFGVRVTTGGGKIFLVQYPSPLGKRRIRLGPFGTLTVEDARREAKVVLGHVARGGDPFADRRAVATAAHAAAQVAAYTFGTMVAGWSTARSGDRRQSYIKEAVACVTRNLPAWWERPAASITVKDAVAALDAVRSERGIVAANRTLAYARAAYSWALRRESVPLNPLKGIERPGREVPRERVLSADELGAIWRASETLSPVRCAFVRVLMLTMQRLGEVESMRWSELDQPNEPTVWALPGERAKNGKPHLIHLAEAVRLLLRGLPVLQGNPFVFAGEEGNPIDGSSNTKAKIEKKLGTLGVTIADWRFHDFRRAGVTALAGMGFAPHVCDRLLNHVTGSIQGVAAVYQRHEFLAERKAALDAWAAYVVEAAEGKTAPTNVVAFERAAS
jgi:integrase